MSPSLFICLLLLPAPTLIPSLPSSPTKTPGSGRMEQRRDSWIVSLLSCSTVVRLSVSACCAATAAGAKLPFDLESSNQLSQRSQITFCAWPWRVYLVWSGGRVADVWLEMNSIPDKAHCPHFRPSFSSLVGRTELPLLLFPSFLFVPPLPVFLGMGIHRFTYWTVAENAIFRRSGFRFASSNADVVAPLSGLCVAC